MIEEVIKILINSINSLKSGSSTDNQMQIKKLQAYLQYLEKELAIEDNEFEDLFQFIANKDDIQSDTKKHILMELGFYYWIHNDHSKEETEIIEANDVLLSEEEFIKLLQDFGFEDLFIEKMRSYKKDFNNLKRYSSIEKIQKILACFHKLGFDTNDFDERERQLLLILTHSNEDIIEKIMEFVKEDLINDGKSIKDLSIVKKRFGEYLGHVSLFGEKTRILQKKERKSPTSSSSKSDFLGTFLNYKANREFLKRNGIKIKLDSLSSLEKNPELIKDNLFLLKKYGFSNDEIEQSLSVLSVYYLEDLIDLSIELKVFDRFKIHPSHFVSFNRLIAMRIKYCQLHNISIDGRNKKELSLKVSKQSSAFDISKGGPEEINPTNQTKVAFEPDKVGKMIGQYSSLLKLSRQPILVTGMTESQVEMEDIFDIEYLYTYRKTYLKSILIEFDRIFSFGKLQYIFKNGDDFVVISRLKVQKNLLRVLYHNFQTEISDECFDNISNVLLYCIEKNSLLTSSEEKIIHDNVYAFVDNINIESKMARGEDHESYIDEYTKRRTRLDSNRS